MDYVNQNMLKQKILIKFNNIFFKSLVSKKVLIKL